MLGRFGRSFVRLPKNQKPRSTGNGWCVLRGCKKTSGFVTKLFHIHRLFTKEVTITDSTLQEVCQHRQFLIAFSITLKR